MMMWFVLLATCMSFCRMITSGFETFQACTARQRRWDCRERLVIFSQGSPYVNRQSRLDQAWLFFFHGCLRAWKCQSLTSQCVRILRVGMLPSAPSPPWPPDIKVVVSGHNCHNPAVVFTVRSQVRSQPAVFSLALYPGKDRQPTVLCGRFCLCSTASGLLREAKSRVVSPLSGVSSCVVV